MDNDNENGVSRRHFLSSVGVACATASVIASLSTSADGQRVPDTKTVDASPRKKYTSATLKVWFKSSAQVLEVTSLSDFHFDGVVHDYYNFLMNGSPKFGKIDDLLINFDSVAALQAVRK